MLFKDGIAEGLNPCFNGRYSQSLRTVRIKTEQMYRS